jgi:N-acylneuraminate cytidylyltransferase
MENNLAIIPARGGSKRIPQKNIKPFLGKPIIAYSIELARNSGIFSEIMVSTDDESIAEIAREYGADIPFFRGKKTSDDHAILNDVLKEVLYNYQQINQKFNHICMILPTAPLIQPVHLMQAYELLCNGPFDSVRPVVRYSYPVQRSFTLKGNHLDMLFPENYRLRSQDLEPIYHDAGQFYWIRKGKLLTDMQKGGIIIPELEAHDIDTADDWLLAELKYKLLFKIK